MLLGRGSCVVTAICEGTTYQCCLDNIDRVSAFWRVLEQFADNLRCCQNLFSSTEFGSRCSRCNRTRTNSSIVDQPVIRHGKRHAVSYGSSNTKHEQFFGSFTQFNSMYDHPREDSDISRLQSILSTSSSRQDSVFESSRPESITDTSRQVINLPHYDAEKEDVNVEELEEPTVIKRRKIEKVTGNSFQNNFNVEESFLNYNVVPCNISL